MKTKIYLAILLLFHLFLILKGGYFLSPEFSLYPFLTQHGFLPYQNIIDQHFPILLFGPFSLPFPLSHNPGSLLLVLLGVTLLTDLFFYLSLLRSKSAHPLLFLTLFTAISFYFQGNFLWLDSFISFFISLILFLSNSKRELSSLALGFFLSLIVIIKPTLFPLLILLPLALAIKPNRYLLVGISLPFLVEILYLVRFDLLSQFYNLTIRFNADSYLSGSQKIPTLRQIIETVFIIIAHLYLLIQRKRFVPILLIITTSVLAFPRFEYFHLGPSLLLLIYFSSRLSLNLHSRYVFYALCFLVLSLSVIKIIRHNYHNYYADETTLQVANSLKELPGNTLYLLGGNDLLYPLTAKTPPGFLYLPSLPWYLSNSDFQKRQIMALSDSPLSPVIVNPSSTIDGQNIFESAPLIAKFINSRYVKVDSVANYEIYLRP